jgi:hypothetical protein
MAMARKGCGINVSTPAPMTALSVLCPPGQQPDIETVLALILTKFERLWTTFVRARGSWAPFEEDYLDAWMHWCVCITSASYVTCLTLIYYSLGTQRPIGDVDDGRSTNFCAHRGDNARSRTTAHDS